MGKPFFGDVRFTEAGMRFTAHQLIIIASAVVVLAAVHVWLEYTSVGRLLRAVGDNRRASEVLGLVVSKARVLAFLSAGIIAGVTGVLVGPLSGLAPLSGVAFLISGFVALFLGGSGKTLGAAVGALVLAAVNIIASRYLGAAWKDYCVLTLALVVFAVRPQGIVAPIKRRPS
jgi:branched-chain amino acid transport system permease protein